jgi:hypothetical protein
MAVLTPPQPSPWQGEGAVAGSPVLPLSKGELEGVNSQRKLREARQ